MEKSVVELVTRYLSSSRRIFVRKQSRVRLPGGIDDPLMVTESKNKSDGVKFAFEGAPVELETNSSLARTHDESRAYSRMFSTSIRGDGAREIIRSRSTTIHRDRRGTIVLRHHRFLSMHRETRLYARNMLNRVRGNSDHVSSPCKWLERLMTIPCHGRKSTGHRFFFPPLCHSAAPPRFLTLPSLPPHSRALLLPLVFRLFFRGTSWREHSDAK